MALLGKRQVAKAVDGGGFFRDPDAGDRIPELVWRPVPVEPEVGAMLDAVASGDHERACGFLTAGRNSDQIYRLCSGVTDQAQPAGEGSNDRRSTSSPVVTRTEVRAFADHFVAHQPQHPTAHTFRCAALSAHGWSVRGDTQVVSSAHAGVVLDLMRSAENDVRRAVHLGAGAEIYTFGIGTGMALGIPPEERVWRFEQAQRLAPFFVPAVSAIIQAASERWGGPSGMSLGLARWVSAEAPVGHACHGGIAAAHLEAVARPDGGLRTEDVDAYFKNGEVQRELASGFDALIEGMTEPITPDQRWALSAFLVPLYRAGLPGRMRYALLMLGDSPDPSSLSRSYHQTWDRHYQLARHRLGLLGVEPRQKLVGIDLSIDDWNSGRVMDRPLG